MNTKTLITNCRPFDSARGTLGPLSTLVIEGDRIVECANQIKIMAGGGVASPTDPIDGTQYSLAELAAICEEAEAANTYVMAHAYSPRAITRAVRSGVRSIEHGNLLDEDSARVMKEEGAFLVPTLVTYAALGDEGVKLGWSPAMLAKLDRVRHRGVESIAIAKAAGVPIAFGSDLLGHMHDRQNGEFALRAPVQTPLTWRVHRWRERPASRRHPPLLRRSRTPNATPV